MLKRIIDIVGALVGLVVLAPLWLPAALLIKLDSPGPVFYVAKRYGRHRERFDFYKFRTMVADADRRGSRMLTTAGDVRVTRVGKYLRAFKIDELPQLINVLKGDMSLVGPRPEVPEVVDHHYQDQWDEVLSVQPGITCLLQIEVYPDFSAGHDGVEDPIRYYIEHDLPLKLKLDREYVAHASVWLDLKIIAQTVYCILVKSWPFLRGRTTSSEVP